MRYLAGILLFVLSAAAAGGAAPEVKSAALRPSSLIARTAEGERQVIFLEVEGSGFKGGKITLRCADWAGPLTRSLGDIAPGKQAVKIHVPLTTRDVSIQGDLESAGARVGLEEIRLGAPRNWTVYLAQHTHTDIGYTRPQTEILPEHLRYIDYALDFCEQTDAYPDDAKFRWTCEISWAVREYLRRRPPEQIARLKRRVAEGRIELTGMFLNMSEIADENSLAASLQPLREIEAVFGKAVRAGIQNDVNGAAWCLPDYYSGAGVRYLIMGINKTRSILPFDRPTPFWWESPSGKRLLAFRADHYMTGNFWKVHEGKLESTEPGLAAYLNNLEKTGYPFDRIGVQFSGYPTDNSPPARKECDLVKAWNEAYVRPRLRIATAGEFLDYIEKNRAADLPVHRQAWPDWWTDGFGSAARETAASRETHAAMRINEGLLAIASLLGAQLPSGWMDRAAAVYENLLFYDEHTFGAAESISDPMAQNSMVQWGEKGAYAWEAVKGAAMLREEALGLLQPLVARSKEPTVVVFNTLGRQRSGPVVAFIDHEILPPDRRSGIVDAASGKAIPAQRIGGRAEGSYWVFWAQDVPALGFKTLRIEVTGERSEELKGKKEFPAVLENAFYAIKVDFRTGAVSSLKDKETGRELVDSAAPWQLGQFVYERMDDRGEFNRPAFKSKAPFRRTSLRKVEPLEVLSGPVWRSLKLKGEADGCVEPGGVQVEIRLFETEKRIEVHYAMRKAPVTAPEAVYVVFPFTGTGLVYEGQGGIVVPGEGQLPGSSSDWQTIQSFVAVRDGDGQVILGSSEAPLVQLGDINLGKWQRVTKVEKPRVYSWVMNNYWFTNFRASQEGEFRWAYYLTSSRDKSNALASSFGWESRVPLVARVLTAGPSDGRSSISALKIDAPNLALVAARPARDGRRIILHVREVEGKPANVRAGGLTEVNVLEEPLGAASESVAVQPWEAKFLRVEKLR